MITNYLKKFGATILVLTVAVFIFISCEKPEETVSYEPVGYKTKFTESLATKYFRLSRQIRAKDHLENSGLNSNVFRRKSERLAKGIEEDPEHPQDWNIRDKAIPMLMKARRDLMSIVSTEMINTEPELSADAYLYYDCWIEEEQSWQVDQIGNCRNNFFTVLNRLQQLQNLEVAALAKDSSEIGANDWRNPDGIWQNPDLLVWEEDGKKPQKEGKAEAKAKKGPIQSKLPAKLPNNYKVLFDFDSTEISEEAKEIINQVANQVKDKQQYKVILNGYADRVGDEAYNLKLSIKRAKTIRDMLVKNGVQESSVEYYGFGEFDADDQDDSLKDTYGRMVEIFIQL